LSIRHGRWLKLGTTAETHVLRWNGETENLDLVDPEDPSAQDATTLASNGRGLVDYAALQNATSHLAARGDETEDADDGETPHSSDGDRAESTDWPGMTAHISPSLLNRVLSSDWLVSSVSSTLDDTEAVPGLSHLEASNVLDQLPLNLLSVNLKQTWAEGDIGRTRTDRARDRSWYLTHLIETVTPEGKDRVFGAREILGELQFCFLMVLTLANYSCLEQWKRLLSVFLTCRTALDEVEEYFVQVLKVLRLQMRHVEDVEGGLFDLRDENASSWLRSLWARFRAVVDEAPKGEMEMLKKEVADLQRLFEDKYGWQSERDLLRRGMLELEDGEKIEVTMAGADEEEETGEYAPVIVET
jgi:A1 cistron-splicing factor AAR2